MQDTINIVQIGLTLVFLLFCVKLLYTWRLTFQDAIRTRRETGDWTPHQWLVVGIFVGFAGNIFDNLFWGATWSLVHLDSELMPTLMDNGPLANIFFRMIPGIFSVYCHLKAAQMMTKDKLTEEKGFFLAGAFLILLLAL